MLSNFKYLTLIFIILSVNYYQTSCSSFEGQILDCTNSTDEKPTSVGENCLKVKNDSNNYTSLHGKLSRKFRQDIENNNNEKCLTQNSTSFICSPQEEVEKKSSFAIDQIQEASKPSINVYIRTSSNQTILEQGSNLTIECRFDTILGQDFKFKLRWLRHVAGQPGLNQSISQTDTDSPMTIIAATTRIWTVQRLNGLDLELNDFQDVDSGYYFCQAISLNNTDEIISESEIYLKLKSYTELKPINDRKNIEQDRNSTYSQENLSKLLPSLKVVPNFVEVAVGESIQLFCITDSVDDPDPDSNNIEWSFEYSDRTQLHIKEPIPSELPSNVSQFENVLMIWNMTSQHIGFYKCIYKMAEFNLTKIAVAEISLSPNSDSAPIVSVSPEVVRLSPNGSTTIQCEATGYPPPDLIWYRVDSFSGSSMSTTESSETSNTTAISDAADKINIKLNKYMISLNDHNIREEIIQYKDCFGYCIQHKCLIKENIGKYQSDSIVTGISLIRINSAQAQHQGQYVCQANNKHGSNQASTIVDVEFREPPSVSIEPLRKQFVFLSNRSDEEKFNVTFECSITSGKPQPKLRWLRTHNNKFSNGRQLRDFDSLDIYDLTKISSASSNISTWLSEDGNSLSLSFNTISFEDEGDYICLAENDWGRSTALAHLAIKVQGTIKIPQSSPFVARINDSFHLDCVASGHPLPVDLEWNRSDRGAFFSLISRNNNLLSNQERAVLKFDRVTIEDSGEYTCNARDSSNSSIVYRDTIMVLIEEPNDGKTSLNNNINRLPNSLYPRLMVRPTKVDAVVGSNVTLDCLAVSGLQPTVVEWVGPPIENENNQSIATSINIKPYYRNPGYEDTNLSSNLLQFGSKLKIINITKAHEGVYQCRGRNKVGLENAPALLKIIDSIDGEKSVTALEKALHSKINDQNSSEDVRTKLAKLGSNIELKCQVTGFEQPITSWSRDGLELPNSAVQIEHNLWIQNVTSKDSGLYVCSAKPKQSNKVIQARIRLMVTGDIDSKIPKLNVTAKIIPSKSVVNVGDSITLECLINLNNHSLNDSTKTISEAYNQNYGYQINLIDDLERNVIWTNLHSGQSLFQDNVYVQNNLLIIYELKPEDSTIYRCNYNDLTQYTDYKLQVLDSSGRNSNIQEIFFQDSKILTNNQTNILTSSLGYKVELKQIPLGSKLIIDCPLKDYQWFRIDDLNLRHKKPLANKENKSIIFETIKSEDADIYQCRSTTMAELSFLVQVLIPVARFTQKPISFISLPTIAGADHQLDLEVKFLPERDTGLILFNGQQQNSTKTNGGYVINGDYISLGLKHGYLEFRFELGDGTTQLRSHQPLSLNQWHKVVIERNQKGAVMYIDRQPPVSNSSTGKFLNLNLDSVLYVGGHQFFMNNNVNKTRTKLFYGYSRGFQGCISSLRIFKDEINLMARNRSVSIGIYECDKPECSTKAIDCNGSNGVCQVVRNFKQVDNLDSVRRASGNDDLRCICLPDFVGNRCDKEVNRVTQTTNQFNSTTTTQSSTLSETILSTQLSTKENNFIKNGGACQLLLPCNTNGTTSCQTLTTTSFKCHCALGFVGSTCSEKANFSNETSVGFNSQAYLQLSFNKLEEVLLKLKSNYSNTNFDNKLLLNNLGGSENFDQLQFTKLTSMADQLNVSFNLQTKSSYGIIFYTGGHQPFTKRQATTDTTPVELDDVTSRPILQMSQLQTSKSMVANLLSRLSTITGQLFVDYLAIALVDGHLELNFELGSGVAIIRSTQRVNDGNIHLIKITRNGKRAKLIIDDKHTQEGISPGKLSVLNSNTDIYLGGLPHLMMGFETNHNSEGISSNNVPVTTTNYLSSFVGCLSNLEINTLGPLNLIRSTTLNQVKEARNLAPCSSLTYLKNVGTSAGIFEETTSTTTFVENNNASGLVKNTKPKPYQSPPVAEIDDPDEM